MDRQGRREENGYRTESAGIDMGRPGKGVAKSAGLAGPGGPSRRWTQAEPDNGYAWIDLGFAYSQLDRHQEALKAYREVLRIKPDNSKTLFVLGITYNQLGRHQEASAAYREALRLKPDYVKAWAALAFTYDLSGNRSAALEAVKGLPRYDPQKANDIFNLIVKP